MLKIYSYKKCSTCRNALKFLDKFGIEADVLEIRETPPSIEEIAFMVRHYDDNFKPVMNTSGQTYRQMNLKDKLPKMAPIPVSFLLRQKISRCSCFTFFLDDFCFD
ncbi:MAG: arsenate reductase family protein [Candidatus Margulisbacteria bacterium]|nr:arsenate reductase family protein [Candidatus Margulisiibacteriota bacterium]